MKTRQSKLDAHAEQLREWEARQMPLTEMAAALKADGCSVSLGRLSEYLSRQRELAAQERLLAQITTGSRACRAVEEQFATDAPPELESLIKLHRVLIMQLATQATAAPELIELVTASMKPVLQHAELQLKQQSFALEREKFLAALKPKVELAMDEFAAVLKHNPELLAEFNAKFRPKVSAAMAK